MGMGRERKGSVKCVCFCVCACSGWWAMFSVSGLNGVSSVYTLLSKFKASRDFDLSQSIRSSIFHGWILSRRIMMGINC